MSLRRLLVLVAILFALQIASAEAQSAPPAADTQSSNLYVYANELLPGLIGCEQYGIVDLGPGFGSFPICTKCAAEYWLNEVGLCVPKNPSGIGNYIEQIPFTVKPFDAP